MTSLVNEGALSEAEELVDRLTQTFPDSSDVFAARGDRASYLPRRIASAALDSRMGQAQKLYVQALKVREAKAHAHYGMCGLFRRAPLYATVRLSSRSNVWNTGTACCFDVSAQSRLAQRTC